MCGIIHYNRQNTLKWKILSDSKLFKKKLSYSFRSRSQHSTHYVGPSGELGPTSPFDFWTVINRPKHTRLDSFVVLLRQEDKKMTLIIKSKVRAIMHCLCFLRVSRLKNCQWAKWKEGGNASFSVEFFSPKYNELKKNITSRARKWEYARDAIFWINSCLK